MPAGDGGRKGSLKLQDHHVTELVEAAAFASTIGMPFNRMITISWDRAGVSDTAWATGRYLKCLREFLLSRGARTAFIWTLERGKRLGLHVHILIHVPPELARDASYRQRKWLCSVGTRWCKGVIKSRPIGSRLTDYLKPQNGSYDQNREIALAYVLKNCDLEMMRALGSHFSARSGFVAGRRYGTSQNIKANARQRYDDLDVACDL